MELRHLRALVAVAEELHFGRAAIRLNISQPPLSQQIIRLEAELGVKLFTRSRREVRLTEAGKRVVDEARLVLGQAEHLSKVAFQAGEGEIGHLSVGVPGGVNETLISTLRLVGRRYPGVRIELQYMTTGIQVEALREGKINAGVLNLPVYEPSLSIELVRREPLCLAIPKGHPLAKYSIVPVEALEQQPIIMFARRVAPGLHDVITGMCRSAGFTLNAIHETDNVIASLTLVSAGLGISFCTPSVRSLWPDLLFRNIKGANPVEQAVAYRRDAVTPVLEVFLGIVRRIAINNANKAREKL